MQKWEYCNAYVTFDKKQDFWVARPPNGNYTRLTVFLADMGENGWEICGSAQASALAEVPQLDHWLYFKRPRV